MTVHSLGLSFGYSCLTRLRVYSGTEECLWIELSYPAGILFIQEPRLTKNQSKEECNKDPKLQGLTKDDGTVVYYLADYDSQVIVAKWKPSFDAPARGSQGSALLRLRGGGATDSDQEGSDWDDLVGSLEDSEPEKVEVITVTNWSDAIDREWEFFEPMEDIHMAVKQAWTKADSRSQQKQNTQCELYCLGAVGIQGHFKTLLTVGTQGGFENLMQIQLYMPFSEDHDFLISDPPVREETQWEREQNMYNIVV
ncbi:hypothetical protein K474DRAFT_1674756 [Panus rudis PR-1116 ss-1]|nr:hypothetical protein K474DRAFT_1674756 [Panus rudis PR-1116 ss-1]